MVSTRPRRRAFEKGEKVLCYEPDPTKAKVLYDSKILGIYETRDKHGKKSMQYKVHFQGWSNSWDRKVGADFLLKDTEENRQLQRDLAEKAQLQIGINLYRRDGKKRSRKSVTLDLSISFDQCSPKGRSSEDNCSTSTFGDYGSKDDCETESYCSSMEGYHDEERVMLRVSERLRQYLEYDYDMIVKQDRKHILPARVPIIVILESFVKQNALKLVVSTTQTESTRRRSTQQRTDKKEREFDKLATTVGLLKEIADGLRIYFDFTIADYLLYKREQEYALAFLSEEDLKTFTYIASPDIFTPRCDTDAEGNQLVAGDMPVETTPTTDNEEPQKRKLRSYRSDDCEMLLESCLSSIASTSSGASTPLHSNVTSTSINYLKSLQAMVLSISSPIKDLLQDVLAWRLLPSNAPPAPSMIFGAPHLARLLVKLPDFLNSSSMTDEKLKILLQHLDSFTNFLETQKEWFTEDNYVRSTRTASLSEGTEQPSANLGEDDNLLVETKIEDTTDVKEVDAINTITA